MLIRETRNHQAYFFITFLKLSIVLIFYLLFTPKPTATFAATTSYSVTNGFVVNPIATGATFFTTEFTLIYQQGKVILSSNPDGTGATGVDDAIEITVTRPNGTITRFNHSYQSGCYVLNPLVPTDLTYLFLSGENKVKVRLYDICGISAGSTPLNLVNLNAPDPPQAKTPLIIIPGIGGSELKVAADTDWSAPDGHQGTFTHIYPSGEKIWINELEAIKPGNDDYFDILRMKPDGTNSEANLQLTGSLVSQAYQPTIDFFTSNGYTPNKDLFVFPYDWRKDISQTSPLLDQKIDSIKQQTGSSKVDLLAHSMGGLVARNYISDSSKAQKVRKLFTLGIPHLGSAETVKQIIYGDCLTPYPISVGIFCLGIAGSEVKDILQNLISGYELTPTQSYFNFYPNNDSLHPYPYKKDGTDLNYDQIKSLLTTLGYNTSLYTPSELFHSVDNSLPNTNGVDVTIIAGSGIKTLGQIIERTTTSLLGIKTTHKDSIYINGDETVPLYSASLSDSEKGVALNGQAKVYYTNQNHGSLVANGPALNLVKNILDGNNQLPAGVSATPYKFKGTGLSVHSPLNIHVYDGSNNHIGPTTDGFETNIPGSSYETLDDAKFVFLPNEGIYTVKLKATNQGSFDFKIRRFDNNENTASIIYKDISLSGGTDALALIDTSVPEQTNLQIDQDGNGTIDKTVAPTAIVTGNENFDQTPPEISIDADQKLLWPPNNKMIYVKIVGYASDTSLYKTTFKVTDEYGLVEPTISEFGQTIKLQAGRREDDLDGRKYTIKAMAEDLAGNTSEASIEIVVPHDQREKAKLSL